MHIILQISVLIVGGFMQKGTEHLPTHGNEDYNGTEDMVRDEILHL